MASQVGTQARQYPHYRCQFDDEGEVGGDSYEERAARLQLGQLVRLLVGGRNYAFGHEQEPRRPGGRIWQRLARRESQCRRESGRHRRTERDGAWGNHEKPGTFS